MRVVDLIRRKRDSGELTREEIEFLIAGYTRSEIPDYQMAAWLMAVLLKGMTRAELSALTEAMLHSGQILDFSDLPARKVDKHSTGAITSFNVNLSLAEFRRVLATCGCAL